MLLRLFDWSDGDLDCVMLLVRQGRWIGVPGEGVTRTDYDGKPGVNENFGDLLSISGLFLFLYLRFESRKVLYLVRYDGNV
jgi:hypothetical protein